jgi:hypothetical protein
MKSRVIQDEPEGNDPPHSEAAPAQPATTAGRSRLVVPGVLLMAALLIVVLAVVWT